MAGIASTFPAVLSEQPEQSEQSEHHEQSEQPEHHEHLEQFKQPEQSEQFKQPAQPEHLEHLSQFKQPEHLEHLSHHEQSEQFEQPFRVLRDALADSSDPHRSTDALFPFESLTQVIAFSSYSLVIISQQTDQQDQSAHDQ